MKWTIQNRLYALAACGIAITILMGVVGFSGFRALGGAIAGMKVTGEALSNHDDADMMHDALRGDVMAAMLARTPEESETARADLKEHADNFRAQIAENEKLSISPELSRTLAGARPRMEEYIAFAEKMVELASQSPDAARASVPEFLVSFSALEEEMEHLSVLIAGANEQAEKKAAGDQRFFLMLMSALAIGGAVTFLAGAAALIRSVVAPIRRFESAMHDMASGEGDLTRRMEASGTDEIGSMARAFNEFVSKIHDVILHVKDSANSVAQASRELTSASDTISGSAQEQASSLEETAASLEQITSTVRQNADNAQTANQLADNAREVAEKGGSVVSSAVSAMSEINSSSRRIADIITTIDEIAFQTNLLALNAAVEAARAGEQGRGFAVVASEVRSLAQRSATAAREIKGLIEDSVHKVETGAGLVNRSGATLDEIVTAVKRVTDVVAEIAAASREQSVGIEQVNRAVTQMDQVTQSNAAQTEELSATAGHLAEQAAEVQSQVGRFRVDGGGSSSLSHGHPRTSAAPARAAAPQRRPAASAARRATPISSHPRFEPVAPAAPAAPRAVANLGDGFEEF
ncbi:MAG: HAMP domain-containing protein [Candidatus Eisenbacteria bacterium]|nr:HAMP domain-containing protein [Candidatus Eisenbacteria bacterium]